ncbi:hypothetical protein J1605_000520 [Eschrichtius robustus]|uniref:Uncharacterized protein n=1 Tax=Eschrichtius robustus TaxID=9764 RepID=A0AB34H7L8_ESCRO|nr:hypothetical protein J1605_000520 [Eschrichtius robustus]
MGWASCQKQADLWGWSSLLCLVVWRLRVQLRYPECEYVWDDLYPADGGEESYNVNDYSLRDQLLVESCDSEELNSPPGKNSSAVLYSRQSSASHLFTLTVLSNHVNEKVEMLLGAETQ